MKFVKVDEALARVQEKIEDIKTRFFEFNSELRHTNCAWILSNDELNDDWCEKAVKIIDDVFSVSGEEEYEPEVEA